MEKGDQLCILRDHSEDPRSSEITRLVAALVALGIPLDPECGYIETREIVNGWEQRVVTWTLRARSDCGRYDTRRMIAAWSDDAWIKAYSEHPLAYLKAALGNLEAIGAQMKRQAPLALIRKGTRIALIPFDATPERREQLLTALEK
jgi:hypothetical protein